MISHQLRRLGIAGTFMVSAAIVASPTPVAANGYSEACMQWGRVTCDPMHPRYSDEWWVCYHDAASLCEEGNPPPLDPGDPPYRPWP